MGDFIKRCLQRMDEWEAERLGMQIASLSAKIDGFFESKNERIAEFDRDAELRRQHFEREQRLRRDHFLASVEIDGLRDKQDMAKKCHRMSVICRSLSEES